MESSVEDTACGPLHVPTPATIDASQMTDFIRFCEAETQRRFADHASFHAFTTNEFRRFWSLFLRWSRSLHQGSTARVCVGDDCETASFFPDVQLGYAENLLRLDAELDGDRPALTARDGLGRREQLTRRALRDRVARLAAALDGLGVVPGDRIVAVVHNDTGAVIAALGAAAVGATFSTASPDMGAFSVVGRFGQLEPTVLACHLRSADPGGRSSIPERIAEIVRGLPSLKAIITLDDGPVPPDLGVPVHALATLVGTPAGAGAPSTTGAPAASRPQSPSVGRRFPFNHPLYIVFSSGTTGSPKCIVHGAGGTLLEHVKEHRLHCDLGPGDKLFFHTSCSWMMWSWQLSALATGVEIVLYAGAIQDPSVLWRVVSEEGVTAFGTSPAYLQMCEEAGFSPARELPLDRLEVILSTGSILRDHQYDWVRENVGPLPLQSISGGTDILGCFVLGNPNLPVFRGEIQCRSLGLDVQALASGTTTPATIGELVCRNPFPSRPVGFYGDPGGERFHHAYFAQNPGVWTHGDRIEIGPEGRARIHGRSDSVLNVHGVRVGPAEIYRILEGIPEIHECLAVEQQARDALGQSRLVLLVVLRAGCSLDGALKRRIRMELAARGSPAHVPDIVLAVPELPVTHSGKRSERAARDAVNGIPAANAAALRNPDSLQAITRALEDDHRGEAKPTAQPPAEEALLRAVTAAWERALDVAPLSPDDDFFALGGTSLIALRLCNALRERTGWEVPPSTLFEAPTIARMVAVLHDGATKPFSPLVLLNVEGSGLPLYIVHGLAGDVLELRALAQRLRGDRPVFGLRARGLDPRERTHDTVEAMARDYVRTVRGQQPEGPYSLAGYSLGGLVAYEMARQLEEAGEQVDFVGLLDTRLHEACLPLLERLEFEVLRRVHRATLRPPRSRRVAAGCDLVRAFIEARLHATRDEGSRDDPPGEQLTPMMARLHALGWRVHRAYRPKPYAGAVTFFRASVRSPDFCHPIPVWAEVTGGRLSICDVPGDHHTMLREPHVDVLASRLRECLARFEGVRGRADGVPGASDEQAFSVIVPPPKRAAA